MPSPGPQEKSRKQGKAPRDVRPVRSVFERLSGGKERRAVADWGEAMPEHLSALVVITTRLGGLITFGRSRDRYALSVNFYIEGEKLTKWLDTDGDIDQQLGEIIAEMAGLEEAMRQD